MKDEIAKNSFAKADKDVVWKVMTDSDHLGQWFGNGQPTRIDLRLGGQIVFDHGSHGDVPAIIETLEEPSKLAFRWAVIGDAGTMPTDSNSTVVEFLLDSADGGTAIRLREHGFNSVVAPADEMDARYKANGQGWPDVLDRLVEQAESTGT